MPHHLSAEERVALVRSIELPDGVHDIFHGIAADKDSAAVAEGSAVSFVSGLEGQMKYDVLDSTLFAQLAANKKHDRQKDASKWYEYYKYVLENVGWTVQSFDLAKLSDASAYFSVDNLLLKLAAAYLTGSELVLFQTMIDGLKQAKNNAATKLFDSSSKSFNKANFQVGIASNSGGNAMFKIGVYTYSADQNIDKVLFFTFGSQKVEFYAGNQAMVLNDHVYAQVRQTILDKLGKNAKDRVTEIDIS